MFPPFQWGLGKTISATQRTNSELALISRSSAIMSVFKAIHLPDSREGALGAARAFAPFMGAQYARERNRVVPGHPYVSTLAAAIRVRLVLEREVAALALEEHGTLSKCEKFVQEIHWRSYWRSWLERHPEIWTRYQRTREEQRAGLAKVQLRRIEQIERGESGCEPMDFFARELVATGYLHNHARMWFAGYWIHTEKLPFELGSDFFERHLICACPAANTLSWRWVAGIQTRGKAYLARRSNLEKYCDPAYLGDEIGMEKLERQKEADVPDEPLPSPIQPGFETSLGKTSGALGLWVTEDDLSPETSDELARAQFAAICTSVVAAPMQSETSNGLRRAYRLKAAQDSAKRAQDKWKVAPTPLEAQTPDELAAQIAQWAKSSGVRAVVALKPFIGPSNDALPALASRLEKDGIELHLLRRPEDARLLNYATSGYFKFWQGVKSGDFSLAG